AEPPADVVSAPGGAELDIAWPRLDLPSKVDGSFQFAGDVRLPGMVHAAIRHGPLDQAELSSFEREAAAGTRGLVGIVRGKRWLAAAAETWWAAEQALDAMAPRFRVNSPVTSARLDELLDGNVRRGETERIAERGNGDEGLEQPTLALRYDVMPAAHGTIETASATARLSDCQPGARKRPGGRRARARHGSRRRRAVPDARWRQLRPAAGTRSCDRSSVDRARDWPTGPAHLVALAGAHDAPASPPGRGCVGGEGRRGWAYRHVALARGRTAIRARVRSPPVRQQDELGSHCRGGRGGGCLRHRGAAAALCDP